MLLHDYPIDVEDVGGYDRDALVARLAYFNMGSVPYISGFISGSYWRFNVGGSLGGHLVLSIPKNTSVSRIYIVFRHIKNGTEVLRTQYITIDDADPKNIVIPIHFFREITFTRIAEPALGVYNASLDYSFEVNGVGTGVSMVYVDESTLIMKHGLKYIFDECRAISSGNRRLKVTMSKEQLEEQVSNV